MLDLFKKVFTANPDHRPNDNSGTKPRDVRLAACALFLEMANIDEEFSEEEKRAVISLLKDEYNLSDEEARMLTVKAREELDNSLDLWTFTNLMNEHYSTEEKMQVVEMLWKIIYSDGRLDKHEDYLVHKLARMLRLSHSQLIDAKLKVLKTVNK